MAGPNVFLSAGEPSGDVHAAAVAEALKRRWPDVRLYGLGGEHLAATGMELLAHVDDLAVMGLSEVAGRLPYFLGLLRRVRERLRRDPPDLVIADAALARRNGYALLRRLRAYATTSWRPVILLAAEASEDARREALDAGADDYLTKPFGARELLSRVGLHLAMGRVGRDASEAVRASERRLAEVAAASADGRSDRWLRALEPAG